MGNMNIDEDDWLRDRLERLARGDDMPTTYRGEVLPQKESPLHSVFRTIIYAKRAMTAQEIAKESAVHLDEVLQILHMLESDNRVTQERAPIGVVWQKVRTDRAVKAMGDVEARDASR